MALTSLAGNFAVMHNRCSDRRVGTETERPRSIDTPRREPVDGFYFYFISICAPTFCVSTRNCAICQFKFFLGRSKEATMYISGQVLLIMLLVGLVAGWLAGQLVKGAGFGLIADVAIGIVGAFIGTWLLPQLGVHIGSGVVSAIVVATIGAVILLLIVALLTKGLPRRRYWRWRL